MEEKEFGEEAVAEEKTACGSKICEVPGDSAMAEVEGEEEIGMRDSEGEEGVSICWWSEEE